MPIVEILRLSFESLKTNKFRAFLTMLGITIGVTSVVLLVSVGNGAKKYVLSEFENLGTNLIIIQPGRTDAKGAFGHPVGAAQRKMTIHDVYAIEKRSFNISAVTGLVLGNATTSFEDRQSNVTIFGVNDRFPDIINITLKLGAFFSREEDDYARRVAILGRKVAMNLFDDGNPLGKSVKINESEFRAIGVMGKMGDKLGINLDDMVMIPTRSALRLFNDDKLFGIRAKARSKDVLDSAVEEISDLLKERRDGEEDFTIVTQGAMMESMSTILNMLTYVLVAIAAISMVVGGVGVMNIMLVNVVERTHEIGIRRAVGAKRVDILWQFIAEAVTLASTGGIIGIALSLAITHGAYFFLPGFDLRAPTWILVPAFLVSAAVGIVFGVWPAYQASRIDTLEALRYE